MIYNISNEAKSNDLIVKMKLKLNDKIAALD